MMERSWKAIEEDAASFPMMYGVGVGEAAVRAAETRLGVAFSMGYRRFRREIGGAMGGSDPVLGLAKAEGMGADQWSVVETTLRFRREGWSGVEAWYVISVDGAGNPVGVDSDGAVFVSDHHGGGILRLADSFEEFLSGLVASM